MKDGSKFNKNPLYSSHKEGSKQLLSNIFFVGSELCLPCHNIKPSQVTHITLFVSQFLHPILSLQYFIFQIHALAFIHLFRLQF